MKQLTNITIQVCIMLFLAWCFPVMLPYYVAITMALAVGTKLFERYHLKGDRLTVLLTLVGVNCWLAYYVPKGEPLEYVTGCIICLSLGVWYIFHSFFKALRSC